MAYDINTRRIERKSVTFKAANGTTVEVSVYVDADKHELTASEAKTLATHLADQGMLAIHGAPYIGNVNLSKMKVR